MPRYWGSWTDVAGGGNLQRFRLGMDWSRSGTRVTVDQYVFEAAYSIYKSITLTRTGRLSGTYSVAVSTSGGVVSLGRGGSVTGSRGGSVTIGGRATNVLHGLVPSFSHTISIPAVAPSAPGRPTVSNVTSGGWRTAWSAPSSNGGASITQYQVQIRDSSGTVVQTSTTSSRSHTNSGRLANTSYTVRVRARNSAGWGSWSSTRSVTTSTLSPNAPTNVRTTRHSDEAFTVNWNHTSTTARPVTSFRVQRRVFNLGWSNWSTRATISNSSTRSWQDTGTRNNRSYQWRVVAVNSSGTATSSGSVSRRTSPWNVQDLVARATSSGIRVSWQDRVRYNSYDYQIQHRAGGGSWSTIHTRGNADHASTVTWTHQDPDLAVTHQYRVRARGEDPTGPHPGEWRETNIVRLAAPPSAPTNLGPSGVWDASEDRTLTWRHVPTDDSDQERFQVRHRLQGGSWTTVSAVASESERWTLPGGTYQPGDTIEWQVRTMGVHPDWSPWSASNFQQPTSRPTVAINTPEDGEEIETNSVLVTWGYSGPDQDDGDEGEVSGQAAWRLTVLRDGRQVAEHSGSDDRDNYRITGLDDGRFYTIRLEVRSGEGLWSAPDEVTVSVSYLPPAPPQVGVSWDWDRGAAVVNIDNPAVQEPEVLRSLVTAPRGRTDTPATVADMAENLAHNPEAVSTAGFHTGSISNVLEHTGEAVRWTIVTDRGVNTRMGDVTSDGGQYTLMIRARASQNMPAVVRISGTTAAATTITTEWSWHVGTATGQEGEWRTGLLLDDFPTGEAWVEVDRVLITPGTYTGDWFSGDSEGWREDGTVYDYRWDGPPHESPSRLVATTLPAAQGWDGAAWHDPDMDAVLVAAGQEPSAPHDPISESATLVVWDADTDETTRHHGRTDATIPASDRDRYVRVALVEAADEGDEGGGGQYIGPYFDGDHQDGAWEGYLYASYAWDGEAHESTSTATIDSIPVEYNQLWRAIDDGPWLLIADEMPIDTAISDPIPAIGDHRTNYYRATAISTIGSAMHSAEHELVVPTHGPGGNHGWVYLNGGTDFSDVVKVRANATRSGSQGLAKTVRRYAGNPRPQQVSGTAVSRTWSIGVNAREVLYEEGMSRPEEIEALQVNGGVICYRDPLGARWFASMGMTDDSYRAITGEVSWSMEEVDQPEGLARESRDQSGDDDDGGEPV